jgi:peroxiredoxin
VEKTLPLWRSRGGEVLVVSFTPPAKMKAFIERHPLPFRIVSDPNRDAYRAFALGRTSVGAFFRPGVLWRYLRGVFRGYGPAKPVDDDMMQLGGDFLIDAEGRLAWSRPSHEPTDRPSANELQAAMTAM